MLQPCYKPVLKPPKIARTILSSTRKPAEKAASPSKGVKRMTKFLLPLAALLTLGTPALANDGEDAARQVVRYDTASLNQAEARRTLMKRIDLAARNVCGEPVTGSKEEADTIRACRTQAASMARAQVPVSFASN